MATDTTQLSTRLTGLRSTLVRLTLVASAFVGGMLLSISGLPVSGAAGEHDALAVGGSIALTAGSPAGIDVASAPLLAVERSSIENAVVHINAGKSAGSGFVAAENQILTNEHVVGSATKVLVTFADGTMRLGTVTATDADLDVAVVRVNSLPAGVRPVDWQSAARPALASKVLAWGYPLQSQLSREGFSQSASVTAGIVSSLRTLNDVQLLQTDAPINAGSSGGPVVNSDGAVVGITVFRLGVDGDDPEGLNFAIDISAHRDTISSLLAID